MPRQPATALPYQGEAAACGVPTWGRKEKQRGCFANGSAMLYWPAAFMEHVAFHSDGKGTGTTSQLYSTQSEASTMEQHTCKHLGWERKKNI